MLSKIYYAIGSFILLIYLAANLLSMIKTPEPKVAPQAKSLGIIREEKGKYVYVPPPPPRYPSSGGSSYPSGGGYSGGK